MQLKSSTYANVFTACTGIIARDGIGGLYRGFLPNAAKNLPNSSIRLSTFDGAKRLLKHSEAAYKAEVAVAAAEAKAAGKAKRCPMRRVRAAALPVQKRGVCCPWWVVWNHLSLKLVRSTDVYTPWPAQFKQRCTRRPSHVGHTAIRRTNAFLMGCQSMAAVPGSRRRVRRETRDTPCCQRKRRGTHRRRLRRARGAFRCTHCKRAQSLSAPREAHV